MKDIFVYFRKKETLVIKYFEENILSIFNTFISFINYDTISRNSNKFLLIYLKNCFKFTGILKFNNPKIPYFIKIVTRS